MGWGGSVHAQWNVRNSIIDLLSPAKPSAEPGTCRSILIFLLSVQNFSTTKQNMASCKDGLMHLAFLHIEMLIKSQLEVHLHTGCHVHLLSSSFTTRLAIFHAVGDFA